LGFQIELEKAFEKLTDSEVRDILFEICLIVNRGSDLEKQNIEKDITNLINEKVFLNL